MSITLKQITSHLQAELEELYTMIFHFYIEYDPLHRISKTSIGTTIKHIIQHPDNGSIHYVYNETNECIGYTILINYWSNEYQGYILFIDELYIIPTKRSLGYGQSTIHLIERTFPKSKAFALEVSPKNFKAQSLYEKIGFKLHKNKTLIKTNLTHP
jgi:GNAT superfamily N-acetyltransferase